jgi:N-acetyl-gamma-glutamyl-phosphate reductase
VRVVATPPSTKATLGSNVCLVHVSVDEPGRRLIAIAAIDNLVKGAAGSAIQNMNAVCGLPEAEGLDVAGVWP